MDNGKVGERTLFKDAVGVPDWGRYIEEMSQHGVTWGDEATLLAASVLFKAEIVVISSVSEDYCHIVTPPDVWKVPLRTRLYLGHYHEYHYVSTRPVEEARHHALLSLHDSCVCTLVRASHACACS